MAERLTEEDISALLIRYPLPDGVEDVVMTREILADAMAVAVPTVSDWIGKGMPVRTMGGVGRAYELQLSHCWAWRQWQKAEQDAQTEKVRNAAAAMRLALVGGQSGTGIEALPPKERREIMEAQLVFEQWRRQRNELMPRNDVEGLLESVFSRVRIGLNSAPDVIEQRHGVPSAIVDALVDICDGILFAIRNDIETFFLDRPVPNDLQPAGRDDLFSSMEAPNDKVA